MSQVDVDQSVGYALKRAQHALHGAMDGELRDYGLSVSQYACLEILAARPRISNADLARDAFVSRQAMHQLLTGLQATGLVSAVGEGRGRRYALTAEGRTRLRKASSTVAAIEQRMLATLSPAEREQLHRQLLLRASKRPTGLVGFGVWGLGMRGGWGKRLRRSFVGVPWRWSVRGAPRRRLLICLMFRASR